MRSNAEKRRIKKAIRAAQAGHTAPKPDLRVVTASRSEVTAQPTPERRARGVWHVTKDGTQDMAHDMVGRLATEGKLTAQQVESARVFQEVRAAYLQEIGVQGFKSCLAGGNGGYDSTDGNAASIVAYRNLEKRIGRKNCQVLMIDLEQIYGKPQSLAGLRAALDAMGA